MMNVAEAVLHRYLHFLTGLRACGPPLTATLNTIHFGTWFTIRLVRILTKRIRGFQDIGKLTAHRSQTILQICRDALLESTRVSTKSLLKWRGVSVTLGS